MAENIKQVCYWECDLPSLELGKLLDLSDPNEVNKFLSQKGLNIRAYQPCLPSSEPILPSGRLTRSTVDLSQAHNKDTKDKYTNGNEDKKVVPKIKTGYTILPSTTNMTASSADIVMTVPGRFSNTFGDSESSDSSVLSAEFLCQTKRKPDVNAISWVDHEKGQTGITYSDGNAIVIEDDLVETVDESNMFGEGLQQQQQQLDEPEVTVRTEGYHRFRYMSEMGNRGTKRTIDNQDGKELVFIHVKNYCGPIKILMFCVGIEGIPHPFYLEGDHCEHGLFIDSYTVNQDLMIRIKQLNIICPTHKDYRQRLEKLKEVLKKQKSCHIWEDKCWDVQLKTVDKSKVRLRVEVIFDNDQQSIVKLSEPIQDRKQGMDFKIHTVRDPSAPVSGSLEGNPVLIVTTNDTNFPKNVDVVLFDNSGWEVKADPATVEIIKKCVVIFQVPPYTKNRDIKDSVTVSLALLDRDTGKRTPPVNFLYYVDSDVYGVKSKKRKLDSLQESSSHQNPYEIRTAGQANSDVLHVVKRKLGNKRRTIDETTISAEMIEKDITESLQEMSDRKCTSKDEPEVANMPTLAFSQMQGTQELYQVDLDALMLQLEEFERKTEACNSEQNSEPVTKQSQTLSKGKLSLTSLPNGLLRISYKGNVIGDFTQESWCQFLQKKRHQKCSETNASASLKNDNQPFYPQQCLYENISMTSDSQEHNPAIGHQQTLDGLLAAVLEQQAQVQHMLKQYVSEKNKQQNENIKNEGNDVLGSLNDQQFSVIPQHPNPITLANTEDYVFNASDNSSTLTLVQLEDGKYYLPSSSPESHQIITDYQPVGYNESQHYIIQDPSAITKMSLSFNQTTTPTHQMIEGQPVLVQHIQQHPTDEYSPTDIQQLQQTAPWVSGNDSTWQLAQISPSSMHNSSLCATSSSQDHTYSDLQSSDLECDTKVHQGDNSIILKEELADNDLEYDAVPVPIIEIEV